MPVGSKPGEDRLRTGRARAKIRGKRPTTINIILSRDIRRSCERNRSGWVLLSQGSFSRPFEKSVHGFAIVGYNCVFLQDFRVLDF